jgi:type IV pilus assembly protein PilM
VRAGGLQPVGIDVKALSLIRSTLPNTLFDDEGAILLLDIGSEMTNLVVAQGNAPTLTRFIPGGSEHFAQNVADAANIPPEDAEKQLLNPKVRIGYGVEEEEEPQDQPPDDNFDPALIYDVRRGLENAAQTLAEDVQRSIEYHYSQPGAREVSQVYISGEGALVNGLDGYLGELLGISTNRGTPLQKLSANKSNVGDDQLRVMEPVLAVSIGLALEDE